jgi:ACS family hexuronate transporter-like MFS transporter
MTDWFPRKERALATGIFNGGGSIGAMLAPLLGVWIATEFGWRMCFLITGGAGVIWIFFWRAIYRDPDQNPKVSPSELEYIRSDGEQSDKPMSVRQLFGMRPVYGLGIAKALSDAPIWFYLTWMPTFLVDQFHLSTTFMAFAIPVIYLVSDFGSIAGGWCSSTWIKAGKPVGAARKLTMLICALLVVPVMSVGLLVDHPPILGIPCIYWTVAIVSLAAGAHQGWSCNLFTMISDTVPPGSTARAVGAINGFAMVGASAMQLFVGKAVQITSSYTLPFVVAGSLYLIALVFIQLFIPHVHQHATDRKANIPWVVVGTAVFIVGLGLMIYDTNKPPFGSVAEYQTARGLDLHGKPKLGPVAQVGWMHANWYRWALPDGTFKYELVKLDSEQRPTIEKKGVAAPHYKGPGLDEVKRDFHP